MRTLETVCHDRETSANELAPAAMLTRAFAEFNEASKKLEIKYETLLKETESLRLQLREKDLAIQRAERLSLLGETAAAIAHEVRNPLGSIKLFVSLLKNDVADRPQAREIVEHIGRSVFNLDHVVSNILQFAKGSALTMGPVNLHSIVQEQVQALTPCGEQTYRIATHLSGNGFIEGNECALRQVIYNLLLNALQATKYRGTIEISSQDGCEGLNLIVRDDGPGIPSTMLDRLFEPFCTSRNEGTGLGLAIVKQIVTQHQGAIEAENNGGAKFTVALPRRQQSQRAN